MRNRRNTKLTAAEVYSMRERYAQGGVTQLALAQEHGVSLNTIRNALSGATWGSVPQVASAEDERFDLKLSEKKLAQALSADSISEVEGLEKILEKVNAPAQESAIEQILRDRAGSDPLGDWRRQRQAAGLRPVTDDCPDSTDKIPEPQTLEIPDENSDHS